MTRSNPLLTRLMVLYDPPDTGDLTAWMTEVARLIEGYSDRDLDRAFDLICAGHRGRGFPTVSEIIGGCAEARAAASPAKPVEPPTDPRWSAEAFRIADEMIQCELGRQAARDGWCLGLHEFIRVHRRLPRSWEAGEIIATSRLIDRIAAGAERGHPINGAKLAASMIAKREAMARKILGEVAS